MEPVSSTSAQRRALEDRCRLFPNWGHTPAPRADTLGILRVDVRAGRREWVLYLDERGRATSAYPWRAVL